jgi:hypothetical protein
MMKIKRAFIAILIVALCGLTAFSSNRPQKEKPHRATNGANYRFESEPRAALSSAGQSTARHARLYLRTSNLYALAVYKNAAGNSQLGLAVSSDGGDAFEPPVMISDPAASVSSHGENSPTLAINGMEYYALWEQSREDGGTDLMFARSLRFGRKFEKPIRVTDKTTPSSNGFSYLAVAPNGDIYAVWLDGRERQAGGHGASHGHSSHGTSGVYIAKSTDKGTSFGKNIRVAPNVCPCCRPTVAFGAKGEVYVAWRTVYEGDIRDIVVATSTDQGATFNQPLRVAVDNWKINGCPHSGPSMSIEGDRLYITWFSEGDSTNAGIRLAWSDNSGKSFAKPVIASGKVVDANHPMLSLSEDGRLMVVFQGRDAAEKDGWGAVRAYVAEVSDTGAVSQPIAVMGNKKSVSYPAIVAGTVGRVYVAWTEATEKGANVFLSRGRREGIEKAAAQNPD